jgi:tetratricopeptide (TPR) repeat protein
VGHYRILRLLGEGGMGAVYEAEQDQPRRRVALKVIKAALASPDLIRRFTQESQTLGRLHHPGIAHIFEAGGADSAFGFQPFFAMELIDGKPLVQYANEHQLSTRGRIELMVQICDAVQHAHQRGIIHRDLKPANILVDENGQPKILDFGLARATDYDTETTRQTNMGQLLGTLAYMSPEQVLADPLALDTRSDVYALGVMLYELLGGRLPYDLPRSLHQALRAIQEAEPVPLGTLNRAFRGDLETIVSKALEKDKNRRYSSASGLAADLQRYLDNQPISARRASAGYQVKKFAQRHKALVTGLSAALGILVMGVVASTWEAVRARRAEAEAERQSAVAQAVNDFLRTDLLAQASAFNQNGTPDPNLTVHTALDRAAARVEGRFASQPLVEASIRETIGASYIDLALYPQAQVQLERALAIRRRQQGEAHRDTIGAMVSLAAVYERNGRLPHAEELYKKVLDLDERRNSPPDSATLRAMNGLAVTYADEGRFSDSAALLERAVPLEKQVEGENSLQTLRATGNLAATYDVLGEHEKARVLLVDTVEKKRRALGEQHPETLDSMTNLAGVYEEAGDYGQAEALLLRTLAGYRQVLGDKHSSTINAMVSLADLYRIEGKTAEAGKLFGQALDISRQALGEAHPRTLDAMFGTAEVYAADHPDEEAARSLSRALDLFQRVLGPDHPNTLDVMTALARVYLSQKKFADAEALLRKEEAIYQKTSPDAWQLFFCRNLLGAALAGRKKESDGEALLTAGFEGMISRQSSMDAPSRSYLTEARDRVVRFYRDSGQEQKAAAWSKRISAQAS